MATQVRSFPSPFLKSLLIGGCRVCRCHPEDVVSLSFCDECGRIETVCAVTFSHKRIKKLQGVNLQYKKVFWPEEKRWVRLRISTKVGPSGRLSHCMQLRHVGALSAAADSWYCAHGSASKA